MAALNELIEKIENPELRAQIRAAADRLTKQKKFGLVFEEHLPECTPLYDIPVKKGGKVSVRDEKANTIYTVLKIEDGIATCLPKNSKEAVQFPVDKLVTTAELGDPIYPCLQPLDEICNAPDNDMWHTLIEADNYHALQLLEYLYAGKVDCIYIDPPYNTGATDWKYNNDYVDGNDEYRHSKWLSMMQKRLGLAKKLLNPKGSVLIVTIDEKEYLHLGCLLEEMFPYSDGDKENDYFGRCKVQMISTAINRGGSVRKSEFSRVDEYIFFVMVGNCTPSKLALSDEWRRNPEYKHSEHIRWYSLLRMGSGAKFKGNSKLYYPIFVNKEGTKILGAGEPLKNPENKCLVDTPNDILAVWPTRSTGDAGHWSMQREKFIEYLNKGYIKITGFTKYGMSLQYLTESDVKNIESGKYEIQGYRDDGSIICTKSDAGFIPSTQWHIATHDAAFYGTTFIKSILTDNRFSYPKSIYAVHDAIRFFVANKPDALIVDFFAGSGTTLHAVNLLNAEDGGNRRCIMVTNNEISAEERKGFEARGIKQGDPEWEARGIARYVTWPRTVCSIEGHDVNGNPLKGNYLGSDIPMADGFKANAVFFKLGFLDKTKVSLGMQFKELLSTLWMKAGAIGKCPVIDAKVPDMLILPENKMAVLCDENRFGEFAEQLALHPEIEIIYLVTDYESNFVAMTQALDGKKTYQLYRDYLDNFRINAGRNGR